LHDDYGVTCIVWGGGRGAEMDTPATPTGAIVNNWMCDALAAAKARQFKVTTLPNTVAPVSPARLAVMRICPLGSIRLVKLV
jgi:hypothetical protein